MLGELVGGDDVEDTQGRQNRSSLFWGELADGQGVGRRSGGEDDVTWFPDENEREFTKADVLAVGLYIVIAFIAWMWGSR